MSRRLAREMAFKLIYQMDFHKENFDQQIELFFLENSEEVDKDFIMKTLKGIKENIENINEIIEKNLKGWTMNRISKVDLSILRLATYEIMYEVDIPDKVSANEAVELAKKFGNDESGSFVNGVLGQVVRNKIISKTEI